MLGTPAGRRRRSQRTELTVRRQWLLRLAPYTCTYLLTYLRTERRRLKQAPAITSTFTDTEFWRISDFCKTMRVHVAWVLYIPSADPVVVWARRGMFGRSDPPWNNSWSLYVVLGAVCQSAGLIARSGRYGKDEPVSFTAKPASSRVHIDQQSRTMPTVWPTKPTSCQRISRKRLKGKNYPTFSSDFNRWCFVVQRWGRLNIVCQSQWTYNGDVSAKFFDVAVNCRSPCGDGCGFRLRWDGSVRRKSYGAEIIAVAVGQSSPADEASAPSAATAERSTTHRVADRPRGSRQHRRRHRSRRSVPGAQQGQGGRLRRRPEGPRHSASRGDALRPGPHQRRPLTAAWHQAGRPRSWHLLARDICPRPVVRVRARFSQRLRQVHVPLWRRIQSRHHQTNGASRRSRRWILQQRFHSGDCTFYTIFYILDSFWLLYSTFVFRGGRRRASNAT